MNAWDLHIKQVTDAVMAESPELNRADVVKQVREFMEAKREASHAQGPHWHPGKSVTFYGAASKPPKAQLTYFASGAGDLPHLHGLYRMKHPIGLSVRRMINGTEEKKLRNFLHSLQMRMVDVFLDSGAFSEVDKNLKVVKPIGDEEWERIFGVYAKAAVHLGEWAHLVLPDRVGSQDLTLARMIRWRNRFAHTYRHVGMSDAWLLAPLHAGKRSLPDLWLQVQEVMDLKDKYHLVPAFPVRAGRVTPADVLDFVRKVKPHSIHLLGMGPRHPDFGKLAEALYKVKPDLWLRCDSNATRAKIGNARGGRKTRDLTREENILVAQGMGPKWARARAIPVALAPQLRYELAATRAEIWDIEHSKRRERGCTELMNLRHQEKELTKLVEG